MVAARYCDTVRSTISNMPVSGFLALAYLGVGLLVAFWIWASDLHKRKTSGIGFLGDLSTLTAFSFLVFVALWPVWLGILYLGSKEDESPSDDPKA